MKLSIKTGDSSELLFKSKEKDKIKYSIKEFLCFLNLSEQDFSKLLDISRQIKSDAKFASINKQRIESLTKREFQVFRLVVEGKSSNEIADELFIQISTVATHRKKIKRKLGLNSCLEAYKYARALGLAI